MPFPIALQLYTLRDLAAKDFRGTLKTVAEIGYAGVEFAGLHGQTPATVRAWLDELGLKASSAHAAAATKANLQELVDMAGTLGLDILVGGCKREAWDTPEGIRRAAEDCQAAAELLKPHGLTAAYHNHWWEMQEFGGKYGLELFAEAAPDMGLEVDVYWARNFGKVDAASLVRRWAKRIPLLHIKDGPLEEKKAHTAVGKGRMDMAPIIAAADAKLCRWAIVELDACDTDMTTAVADSYQYLTSRNLAKGRK
jgi:sugar phosphate isomerase/epimerase